MYGFTARIQLDVFDGAEIIQNKAYSAPADRKVGHARPKFTDGGEEAVRCFSSNNGPLRLPLHLSFLLPSP